MKKEAIARLAENAAFVLIILIGVFHFFELLPVELEYFEKILSWTMMGYLLYNASLTKIFFGVQKKSIDLLLILAYFLLIIKNLVAYALAAFKEESLLSSFFYFIANERFELYAFYMAGLSLIVISLYLSKLHVKKPSLMCVIHETGIPKTHKKKIERFIATYLILVAFFIIIFNLMMEWLAMAVDAPLLMISIFLYLYVVIVLHRKFSTESMIHKIGSFGEKFYNNFIQLFHTKKRILLGFSGILVLFLLVDWGNFILPYVLNYNDPMYFAQLGQNQQALVALITNDMAFTSTIMDKISLAWIYIFNILAMLFALVLPAFIWYRVYRRKGFKVTNLSLSLFFISFVVYASRPIFKIEAITDVSYLMGVIIKTNNVMPSNIILPFLVSLSLGVIVFFLSSNHSAKKRLMIAAIILLIAFFISYISYYFYSMCIYYLSSITFFVSKDQLFFAFYFTLFLIILTIFFISGFIIYLLEIKREFKYVR